MVVGVGECRTGETRRYSGCFIGRRTGSAYYRRSADVKNPWMINRRAFLRGTGAALTLPWLESLASAGTPGAKPPVRLAFFYAPNGIVLDNRRPKAAGELGELLPILKSLEPVKKNILILSDLAADHCQ